MILIFVVTILSMFYAVKKHNENVGLKALNKTLTAQLLSAKKITLTEAVNVCKAHGHNIYDMPDEPLAELTEIKNIVTQILEKIK